MLTWTEAGGGADLVEEALRKSNVLWLLLPACPLPRIAWHLWHDGAACVVHGGAEQELPGLDELREVEICARSKETASLLARWPARVEWVLPDDPRWAAVVAALHAHRQSPPDGADQRARWATQSRVTRLVPLPR